jgi:plasmid maintenance system antidote protein VapI
MRFLGFVPSNYQPLLTRKDVATILGVTVRTLSTLIRSREKQSIAPNKEEAV